MYSQLHRAARIGGRSHATALVRLDAVFLVLVVSTVLISGCKDLTGDQALPAGTANPSSYNTVAGALAQRNAVLNTFNIEWYSFVTNTGALSDEFQTTVDRSGNTADGQTDPDQRALPAGSQTLIIPHRTDGDYSALHRVRGLARQAIGQLATYDSAAPPALRGELYALAGYAEIALADLFCSGVPLSTLNFQQDYTSAPSSTTAQVYQAAVAQFDSALALSADSSRILNLARVGKGRALLDLGQYAQAAQAVADVPTMFQYRLLTEWTSYDSRSALQESDREGMTGLPFVSSGDSRSAAQEYTGSAGGTLLVPTKIISQLTSAGFVPVTVADGIEARLIEAEAALQGVPAGHGSWLDQLNALRASDLDGTNGLAPLADPGATLSGQAATDARVDLLFQERAEWLFATGHRQGDLRRLIRQYHRSPTRVYPVGSYPVGGVYGGDITAPIPSAEYANPLFHGCIDRNA